MADSPFSSFSHYIEHIQGITDSQIKYFLSCKDNNQPVNMKQLLMCYERDNDELQLLPTFKTSSTQTETIQNSVKVIEPVKLNDIDDLTKALNDLKTSEDDDKICFVCLEPFTKNDTECFICDNHTTGIHYPDCFNELRKNFWKDDDEKKCPVCKEEVTIYSIDGKANWKRIVVKQCEIILDNISNTPCLICSQFAPYSPEFKLFHHSKRAGHSGRHHSILVDDYNGNDCNCGCNFNLSNYINT